MTLRKDNLPDFDDAIRGIRESAPDERAMEAAGERVWERIRGAYADPQFATAIETIRSCSDFRALLPDYCAGRLSPGRTMLLEDHLRECADCRRYSKGLSGSDEEAARWTPAYQASAITRWNWQRMGAYAALLVLAAVAAFTVNYFYFAPAPGMRAQVENAQGGLYLVAADGEKPAPAGLEIAEGQKLRTAAGGHAFVRLSDGSRVEMNERAEFSVSATRRDVTLHLGRGNIIVEAAKRRSGRLYVATPDARVAVTGTVFSVNSGMKGSRVSVMEGAVQVSSNGNEALLRPGDQLNTNATMGTVPISEEIAWSENLDNHLKLLAEFQKLQNKLEQIPSPPPRYQSRILGVVPANTVAYASIPNLGGALAQANQIFQEQLQQSSTLRSWWAQMQRDSNGFTLQEMIEKVHMLSQYLGDEVVFIADKEGTRTYPVVLAEISRPGLADFLNAQFGAGTPTKGLILDPQKLANAPATYDGLIFLVRPDMLVVGCDMESIRALNQRLEAGASGFAATPFGQTIQQVYTRGAGMLLAVDLKAITAQQGGPRDTEWERSGFAGMNYLLAEHREQNGQTQNRAVLAFNGPRTGIASWLAAPAPIGSLEFISPNASLVFAGVVKSPAQMVADLTGMDSHAERPRDEGRQYVEQLAPALGNDYALAFDGPVLPTPSWKFVAEVYDPNAAEYCIEKLLELGAAHARQNGHSSPTLEKTQVGAQTYYTIRPGDGGVVEVHYTFAEGYVIAGPSQAILQEALRIHSSGDTLGRSAQFRSLLPQDPGVNFSGVMYQNLAPVLQPLAGQLTASQFESLRTIAMGSKPSVVAVYGSADRSDVASNGNFFGIDLKVFTLSTLLGNRGTTVGN
jgi:ferric-dicitrate binding protein FerR (iron transport regulator)